MLDVKVKLDDRLRQKLDAEGRIVRNAKFRNFGHAAAKIRKTAQQSVRPAPKGERASARSKMGRDAKGKYTSGIRVRRATHASSPPGQPVRTQRGQVRRAIVFDADASGAIIGPRASVVGQVMKAHEFGGLYKGAEYPARPVMGPALDENLAAFADEWRHSIGE